MSTDTKPEATEPTATPVKRGRGRPKGSKNKPKTKPAEAQTPVEVAKVESTEVVTPVATVEVTPTKKKVTKKTKAAAEVKSEPVEHTVKIVVENKPVIGDGEAVIEEVAAE